MKIENIWFINEDRHIDFNKFEPFCRFNFDDSIYGFQYYIPYYTPKYYFIFKYNPYPGIRYKEYRGC